jgi:hypothetical protein
MPDVRLRGVRATTIDFGHDRSGIMLCVVDTLAVTGSRWIEALPGEEKVAGEGQGERRYGDHRCRAGRKIVSVTSRL